MSGVALAQPIEMPAPDTLAILIRQQIARREEARPGAGPAGAMRPTRARAWRVLANGVWKLRRDAAQPGGSADRLPWDTSRLAQRALEAAGVSLPVPLPGRAFARLSPPLRPSCKHVGGDGGPKAGPGVHHEVAGIVGAAPGRSCPM